MEDELGWPGRHAHLVSFHCSVWSRSLFQWCFYRGEEMHCTSASIDRGWCRDDPAVCMQHSAVCGHQLHLPYWPRHTSHPCKQLSVSSRWWNSQVSACLIPKQEQSTTCFDCMIAKGKWWMKFSLYCHHHTGFRFYLSLCYRIIKTAGWRCEGSAAQSSSGAVCPVSGLTRRVWCHT